MGSTKEAIIPFPIENEVIVAHNVRKKDWLINSSRDTKKIYIRKEPITKLIHK